MSVEALGDGPRCSGGGGLVFLAPCSAHEYHRSLCPRSPALEQHQPRRFLVKILPGLEPIAADVKERFGPRLTLVTAPQSNELYYEGTIELVPGFCAQVYKRWKGRLVSL